MVVAMRRASVGTTGIELSAIGLGGFELGETASDVPAARAAIAAAMESGVNWVDTADEYHATANESVIGEALGGLPDRPLISSKRWPSGDSFTPAGIHAGCRASLQRLGVDHLDLYFLHWPDDQIPLQESWGAMAELADQGLARAVGLSNYTLAQIEACHAARPVDVIQDGLSLVDYPENRHKVAACGWQGIASVIYEPPAGGLLAGAYSSAADVRAKWGDDVDGYGFFDRLFGPDQERRTMALTAERKRVAEERGVGMAQLAIAWVLAQPGVTSAICGSRNAAHVSGNSVAAGIELDGDALAELEAVVQLGPAFA
jgi:aryl-alcohol dehydrogenase-like predicted oxidoreductase